MEDTWFEVPELVTEIAPHFASASVRATFSAGPTMEEQSGTPYLLWIAICNSPLAGQGVDAMLRSIKPIVASAAEWLGGRSHIAAGGLLQVVFADAGDGGPFSFFNALETFSFTVSADGDLVAIPRADPAFDEVARTIRYALSGRRVEPAS
jgi:hypothetical protein